LRSTQAHCLCIGCGTGGGVKEWFWSGELAEKIWGGFWSLRELMGVWGGWDGGKQLLGDEIGKGAYGRVYKGLDLENGDFVAIKQVSLENIPPEDLASIMVRTLHSIIL
jgi:hypothetical protein